MKKGIVLLIVFSILVLFIAVYKQNLKPKVNPQKESCFVCHKDIHMDTAHPVDQIGCIVCHHGNPYTTNEAQAHKGLIKNPADLRYAAETCGKCHKEQVEQVETSLMATNRGIISAVLHKFGYADKLSSDITVKDLYEGKYKENKAIQYFEKNCGACHLYKPYGQGPTKEIQERGGGCLDCHATWVKGNPHVELTTHISDATCVKCHNRSGRIGLSYFGHYETEEYGTPFMDGGPSHYNILGSPDRYYLDLPPDVHYAKAHMSCIDCHTMSDTMGLGLHYKNMTQQVGITCKDCHEPHFVQVPPNSLALKLAFLNGKVPLKAGDFAAIEERTGEIIYNVQLLDGKAMFFSKKTGKVIPIPLVNNKPYHTFAGHKDLSCQACHSAWAPQCYGCHIVNFEGLKQLNWIKYKDTPGAYAELNSYVRFETPQLAFDPHGKVMPVEPGCQDFITIFNKDFKFVKSIRGLSVATIDPHTTQLQSRSCEDCHHDPRTMGFGTGNLSFNPYSKQFKFSPTFDSKASGLGDVPLDMIVNEQGKQMQSFPVKGERAFNKDELIKIYEVGQCIVCHKSYEDPIYRDFLKSYKLFLEHKAPCNIK